jgi:hypothetical protein
MRPPEAAIHSVVLQWLAKVNADFDVAFLLDLLDTVHPPAWRRCETPSFSLPSV